MGTLLYVWISLQILEIGKRRERVGLRVDPGRRSKIQRIISRVIKALHDTRVPYSYL